MKSLKVFVILFGIVVARGEPAASNKANQLETKNVHQVSKPTGLETSSTQTQHSQVAHSQYKTDQLGNTHNQDIKLSHHSQLQNSQFQNQNQDNQFHSQTQASQFHNQEIDPQFHSQELNDQFNNQGHSQQFHRQTQAQQFHNQDLAEQSNNQDQGHQFQEQNRAQHYHDQNKAQQYHLQNQAQQLHNQNQAQQFHNQVTGMVRQNQDFSNLQQIAPTAVSMLHSQTKEQIRDFTQQQLYSSDPHSQQGFYRNLQDQHSVAKGLADSSNQQTGVFAGLLRSTEVVKSSGIPQVYGHVSAFEKGTRPIVLPGVTSHSSSVVVSGLKNLPSLPALVYSAGAIPPTQVVAYGRPWHQGGAYMRQHWESPYARYVYSHIL